MTNTTNTTEQDAAIGLIAAMHESCYDMSVGTAATIDEYVDALMDTVRSHPHDGEGDEALLAACRQYAADEYLTHREAVASDEAAWDGDDLASLMPPSEGDDEYAIRDERGGVWHPTAEAMAAIEAHWCPRAHALDLARAPGDLGRWKQ